MPSPSKNKMPKGFQPTWGQWFDSRSTYHAKNNCAEAWQQLQDRKTKDAVEPVEIIGKVMFDFQKQQDVHAAALSVISDVVASGTQEQKREAITHLGKLQKVSPDFIRSRPHVYASLYDSSLCLGAAALDKKNDVATRIAAANGIEWFSHRLSEYSDKKGFRLREVGRHFALQPERKQMIDGFIDIVKDPLEDKALRDGAVSALQVITSSPELNALEQVEKSRLLGANKAITQTLCAATQDQTLELETRVKIARTLGQSLYVQDSKEGIYHLTTETEKYIIQIINNPDQPLEMREAALENYAITTEVMIKDRETKRARLQFIQDVSDTRLTKKKHEIFDDLLENADEDEDKPIYRYFPAQAIAETLAVDRVEEYTIYDGDDDTRFDHISAWFKENKDDLEGGNVILGFVQNQFSVLAEQYKQEEPTSDLEDQVTYATNAYRYVHSRVKSQKHAAENYNPQ